MSILSITPNLLDEVLTYLAERGTLNALNRMETAQCCEDLGIDLETLRNVFAILQHDGLVAELNDRRSVFMFLLTPGVWEALKKGGYTARFKIAKEQLQLLEAEVRELEKKKTLNAGQIERFTNIIANIYSFFPKNLMDF